MAKPLRIEYPGAFYHVMNRSLEKRVIFTEPTPHRKNHLFSIHGIPVIVRIPESRGALDWIQKKPVIQKIEMHQQCSRR